MYKMPRKKFVKSRKKFLELNEDEILNVKECANCKKLLPFRCFHGIKRKSSYCKKCRQYPNNQHF